MKNERFGFVDGLRGIGAAMVVLFHLGGRTSAAWLTQYGYLGVAIFFVLSGFVITLSIGDRKITPGFVARFAARRSIRLDPLYWTSIAIAAVLALLATSMGHAQALPSYIDILAHLLYVQDILGVPQISAVYWTLCLEIQFYLFLLALLWVKERFAKSFPALMLLTLVLSLLEHGNIADLTPHGVFLPYWFSFALGAMLALVSTGKLSKIHLWAAGLIVMIFTVADPAWLVASLMTMILISMASEFGLMGIWCDGPIAQFLGRISYSLYLLHPLIGWSSMSFALQYTNQWLALGVGLLTSVASAWVAYRIIERPSMALSRRVPLEPRTIRSGIDGGHSVGIVCRPNGNAAGDAELPR